MNQKLQRCHQHIFCKHSVKILQGIRKVIFSRNRIKKALPSVGPKGDPIETPSIEV